MAYKRFFNRNGKRIGPYYYESYRDKTGKVKKRYVGTVDPDEIIKNKGECNEIDDNLVKKSPKKVTPTKSNILILVVMILILILTDILFLFYLFGH